MGGENFVVHTLSLGFFLFYYLNTLLHFQSFFSRHWSIAQPACMTLMLGIISLHQKVIVGFAYEYTYQDHDYIFRTMNTKNAQCYAQCCFGFLAPSSTQDFI